MEERPDSATSQGSPHARFRRALRTGNARLATAAAAEPGQVDLADALALTLLYRDQEPQRFEDATVRWHGRLCAQARMISPEEAELALAALFALRLRNPGPAARALAAVLDRLMLTEASTAIVEWLARRHGQRMSHKRRPDSRLAYPETCVRRPRRPHPMKQGPEATSRGARR